MKALTCNRQFPVPQRLFAGLGLCLLLWLLMISPVRAMGLGEISYQSFLGEPLQARVELLLNDVNDYHLDNIHVGQINAADARKLGIELIDAYHGFQFQLQQDGEQLYIAVNTSQPINEPFINILIEVRWPGGSIYREYTVLLDPPSAPVISRAVSNNTAITPMVVQQARLTSSAVTVADVAGVISGPYQVQSGDSLSAIARRVASQNDQSLAAIMDWIHQHNARAFINGDRNRLMAGVRLRLPTRAQLLESQASVPVPMAKPPASTAAAVTRGDGEPTVGKKPVLTLDDTEQNRPTQQTVSEIPAEVLRAHINATLERREALVRENEQLSNRLKLLEASKYVNNLEQLVALKDQQIAALREIEAQQAAVSSAESADKESSTPAAPLVLETESTPPAASATGWWLFYGGVMALLLLGLIYFLRQRQPEAGQGESMPLLDPLEEQAILNELDELANEYKDMGAEGVIEPGEEGGELLHFTQRSHQSRPRRPDDEVMRDIEKRVQQYQPDTIVPPSAHYQHDETDRIISEALSHTEAGRYDIAEAMLLEADFETRGKDGRLSDALEYVSYCRATKGNHNASR